MTTTTKMVSRKQRATGGRSSFSLASLHCGAFALAA